MNITKLIITPVYTSVNKNIIINKPSTERASRLITERLNTSTSIYEKQQAPIKMPKWLKKFVNPKSYTGKIPL